MTTYATAILTRFYRAASNQGDKPFHLRIAHAAAGLNHSERVALCKALQAALPLGKTFGAWLGDAPRTGTDVAQLARKAMRRCDAEA